MTGHPGRNRDRDSCGGNHTGIACSGNHLAARCHGVHHDCRRLHGDHIGAAAGGRVTVPYTITYADRSEQLFEFDGGDTLTDVAAVLKALRADGYRVVMVLKETYPADLREAAAEVGIANTNL
jgi:hypothetical protein